MITKVSFRSFKALREVDLDFTSRLTVLVGPNASGKTSILQGISLLTKWRPIHSRSGPTPQMDPSWVSQLPGASPEVVLSCATRDERSGETGELSRRLTTESRHVERDRRVVVEEEDITHPGQRQQSPSLPSTEVMRLDATRLAEPSAPGAIEPELPRLAPDGSNLAAVLAELALSDPERRVAIREAPDACFR